MSTDLSYIEVSGIPVEVHRKPIKNLHVGVYPPSGRVRVAAPPHVDDEAVRLAIVARLKWIRRQRQSFADQPRQSQREMVTGETHYFQGKRYRLDVVEQTGAPGVLIAKNGALELIIRPGTDRAGRQRLLDRWYRDQLRSQIPELLGRWEKVLDRQVADWRIKRMKTRWGTCNIEAQRIWLNLELAKKSPRCLEYVLVHEMVHLLERRHNDRFRSLLDQFIPDWRLRRAELNQSPLGDDDWGMCHAFAG